MAPPVQTSGASAQIGQWLPRVVQTTKDGFRIEPTEDDIIETAMVVVDRGGKCLIAGLDCDFQGAPTAAPWLLLDVLIDVKQTPIAGSGFNYSSADGQSVWSAYPRKGQGG